MPFLVPLPYSRNERPRYDSGFDSHQETEGRKNIRGFPKSVLSDDCPGWFPLPASSLIERIWVFQKKVLAKEWQGATLLFKKENDLKMWYSIQITISGASSSHTGGQDGEMLPALCTCSVPGDMVIGFWHIIGNRIFLETIRTGEADNISGSRPDNCRFYWTFHHCIIFAMFFDDRRYHHQSAWSYSGTCGMCPAYVQWWDRSFQLFHQKAIYYPGRYW
jgi:hypothetical protein